jgi:adenosine deaminase
VATHASLVQAAADSIRYREMFWNATNHPGVPYETQLEGIVRGIDSARAETGIECRLLPAINRRQSPEDAVELVRQVASNAHPYVVGISMDDDEDSGPPELFVDAFALAAEHGLHRTAHAGELGSAANVATSLDLLHCERIDHGYGVMADSALVERCQDQGVHFTGCWYTNCFHAGVFTEGVDPSSTPLARMLQRGLNVSVNTDDPTMIPTAIGDEYVGAAAATGASLERMVRCTLDGIDASWVDDDVRDRLRAEVLAATGASIDAPTD